MTSTKIKIVNTPLKHPHSNCKLFGDAWSNGDIRINPNQSESQRLNTVIHESLHVIYPKWTEGRVRRVADKLAKVLWRDKWRRHGPQT